jgi:hypothetical protein
MPSKMVHVKKAPAFKFWDPTPLWFTFNPFANSCRVLLLAIPEPALISTLGKKPALP